MIDGSPQGAWESMALRLDNGAEIAFSGRQFAGGSWYDEETGVLTRQNLYITEANEYVYSIITGTGRQRSRRAYRVALHGKTCTMSDGKTEITLELEMLILAVRALTGLDREGEGVPMLDLVEETLRAALPGLELEILEKRPVEYRCDCSRERMERALISLGREELRAMIAEQGGAELTCRFCDNVQTFSREDLEALLACR